MMQIPDNNSNNTYFVNNTNELWNDIPPSSLLWYNQMMQNTYFNGVPNFDTVNFTKRKNATRDKTNILKKWLNEHLSNPYPTKGEKLSLSYITSMNLTQVSTWFANARRRLKKTHGWSANCCGNCDSNPGNKKAESGFNDSTQHSESSIDSNFEDDDDQSQTSSQSQTPHVRESDQSEEKSELKQGEEEDIGEGGKSFCLIRDANNKPNKRKSDHFEDYDNSITHGKEGKKKKMALSTASNTEVGTELNLSATLASDTTSPQTAKNEDTHRCDVDAQEQDIRAIMATTKEQTSKALPVNPSHPPKKIWSIVEDEQEDESSVVSAVNHSKHSKSFTSSALPTSSLPFLSPCLNFLNFSNNAANVVSLLSQCPSASLPSLNGPHANAERAPPLFFQNPLTSSFFPPLFHNFTHHQNTYFPIDISPSSNYHKRK